MPDLAPPKAETEPEATAAAVPKVIQVLTKITDDLVAGWARDPEAADIYEKVLFRHYGWTAETIEKLRIGWDDGESAQRLRKDDVSDADLLSTGHYYWTAIPYKSAFTKRIVFPWLDADGHTLFETGRQTTLTPVVHDETTGKNKASKYTKTRLHKEPGDGISKDLVQSIWIGPGADKRHDFGIVAEGVADAVSAVQAGLPTISPVTTQFSEKQVPELLTLTARWTITYLVPDQEENGSGMKGAIKTADALFAAGRDVRIVVLPHEHLRGTPGWKVDLNEFLAAENAIEREMTALRERYEEQNRLEALSQEEEGRVEGLSQAEEGGVESFSQEEAPPRIVREKPRGDVSLEFRSKQEKALRDLIARTPTYLTHRIESLPMKIEPSTWTALVRPVLRLVATRKDAAERSGWVTKMVDRGVGKHADMKKALAEEIMAVNTATVSAAMAATSGPPMTDLGNAQRLHAAVRGKVHHVREWNSWLVWDGRVWARDDHGHRVRSLAAKMVIAELVGATDPDFKKHWMSSQSKHALDDMVSLLADQPGIDISAEQLDARPHLVNCKNGTLDLSKTTPTGRMPVFRAHEPKDLLTLLTEVTYDPLSTCEAWEAARTITHPDEDVRRYIQKRAGYYLSGEVFDESFELDFGPKGTGKSTYYRILANVLGPYAVVAPKTLFERQKFEQHPAHAMTLRGARLAYGVEIGKRLDHDTIKGLTGRDKITARGMRENFCSFDQTHKLVAFTNAKPIIHAPPDDGIWDRLRVVPWDVPIRGTALDNEHLSAEMKTPEALSGILTWMVQGWMLLQDEGHQAPDCVRMTTAALSQESDPIGPFLDEYCVLEAGASVTDHALWELRKTWNEAHGEEDEKRKWFIAAVLERQGISRSPTLENRTRRAMLKGIRLLTDAEMAKKRRDRGDTSSSWSDAIGGARIDRDDTCDLYTGLDMEGL